MAKDPWKRAYDIDQLKLAGSAQPGPARPRFGRGRSLSSCSWLLIGALALIIAAAVVLYFTRGWWLPRAAEPVIEALEEAVPAEVLDLGPSVDWHAVERGLDVELRLFGDYNLFVGATRTWEPGLSVISTGPDTWRLKAPGVLIYVQEGLIWTYELDLGEIYAEPRWEQWWPSLREAGLTPDLKWEDATGEPERPRGHSEHGYRGPRSTRLKDGWAYPVWVLHFSDGRLARLEGGIDFGVASEMGPQAGDDED